MKTILLVATVFLSALLTLTGHAQDPSIGLAAHYPLDGNASDASENGLDGMVFGAVPTTDRFGNASGAFSFSGSDHITTPFVPVYNTSDALTVTVWIECGVSALNTYVLGLERSDHQEVTIRVMPDGTVRFQFRDDDHNEGYVTSPSTITDNSWHHVTAIRDVSTDQLRIYIDGLLESIETDVTVVAMNEVQSRDMAIGADNNSTFGFRLPFVGKIDDVRFYNRVLTDQEIQQLAGLLAVHYPLDGDASDVSGNGLDGQLVGPPTVTTDHLGVAGGAFHFDGNDYITTPFSPIYDVGDALTISLWVKCNESALVTYIFGYERTQGGQVAADLIGDGRVRFTFRDDNANATNPVSSSIITDDLWHLLTFVRDPAADEGRLYVDGMLETIATDVTTTFVNAISQLTMVIGADRNSTFGIILPFVGDIDDFRFYDRVLSEAKIEELFVEGVDIPIEEQLAAIEDDVNALVDDGSVSNGEGTSLVNKLLNAFAQLEKGKPDQAIKKLEDFIDEVNKLIEQNKLTNTEGQPLIDAAQDVIDQVQTAPRIVLDDPDEAALAQDVALPSKFALTQNYPNPFNPSTEIRFDLPEASTVRLTVYDVMGRVVARLIDQPMRAGTHAVTWDASGLPSGTYLYRLTTGHFSQTRRLTLLK